MTAWLEADDRACRGLTALMYRPGSHKDGTVAARAVCGACPRIGPCRDHARANREEFGVWGGEGPRTRHAAVYGLQAPTHIARRVAVCGTTGGWRAHKDNGDDGVCDPCRDAWNAYKRDLRARRRAAA